MTKPPSIPPSPGDRRPTASTRVASGIQLALSGALIVLLLIALQKFFAVAHLMPGGIKNYLYLPIAMAGFLVLAVVRFWKALRALRPPPRR